MTGSELAGLAPAARQSIRASRTEVSQLMAAAVAWTAAVRSAVSYRSGGGW